MRADDGRHRRPVPAGRNGHRGPGAPEGDHDSASGPLPRAGTRGRPGGRSGRAGARRPGAPACGAGGRSAGGRRQDGGRVRGLGRDVPAIHVGRHPEPRPAGREPGPGARRPRHRRARLRRGSTTGSPAPTRRAAAGRCSPSGGTSTSRMPDLLAVVEERRAAEGQRAGPPPPWRSRRDRPRRSARRPSREACRGWSWLDRTTVGQRLGPNARSRRRIAARERRRRPGPASGAPSRRRGGAASGRPRPRSCRRTARRPTSGPGAHRRWPGTAPAAPAGPAGRCRRRGPGGPTPSTRAGAGWTAGRVLEERVEDVEPEAIDAAVEPAPDHRELGGLDRRGCASSARAARAGTCAGRTGRGPARTSRPVRRTTTPSCWAAAARRAASTPAGSRHRYQSAYGPVRDAARRPTNQGCSSLVWFMTRSSTTRMPAAWASSTSRSKSASRPEQRVDRAWSLTS